MYLDVDAVANDDNDECSVDVIAYGSDDQMIVTAMVMLTMMTMMVVMALG